MSNKIVSRLPAIGMALAIVFLMLAAARFPGGYGWTRHTFSTLFQAITPTGDPNPSRPFAAAGVFCFCAGMAVHFQLMSSSVSTAFHKKTIQIAGMGSMAYGVLTVTPMHDLMVTISLIFFLTAMIAVLHMLYIQRDMRLLSLGIICLVILLGTSVIYYGSVFPSLLPLGQKVSFATSISWLFAVQSANREMKPEYVRAAP